MLRKVSKLLVVATGLSLFVTKKKIIIKNLKLLQLIGLILISNLAFTQDLIFLKSGEEVKVKVIEIGQLEIKYKKFTNLEGPIYTIMKSDVFMIEYENGEKEVFKKQENTVVSTKDSERKILIAANVPRSELRTILRKNPLAYSEYSEGRDLYLAGVVVMIVSDIYLLYDLFNILDDTRNNIQTRSSYFTTEVTLSVAGLAIGGVLALVGKSKVKNSILIYNANLTSLRFAPVINSNGVGLAFRINF